MNALESKIAKALGKKRMAKVQDIMDDGMAVDLLLADGFINNELGDDGMIFDVWDYVSDYTVIYTIPVILCEIYENNMRKMQTISEIYHNIRNMQII